MKLKHIILVLLAFPVIAFSCIEDLGNYDYVSPEDIMGIAISGVNDTVVAPGELLEIEPIIENLDSNVEYTYTWFVLPTAAQGSLPVRDTLSTDKNLSATMKLLDGVYYLCLSVTDKARDIYAFKQVKLTVTATDVTAGWYILKYMDGKTDIDYIKADVKTVEGTTYNKEMIPTGKFVPNVLRDIAGEREFLDGAATVGDQQLEGKPKKIYYHPGNYYKYDVMTSTGELSIITTSAMQIMTDRDIKTFDHNNWLLCQDFEGQFYELPNTREVNNAGYCGVINAYRMNYLYMMVGGKLQPCDMSVKDAVTKYSLPIPLASSLNYKLHDDVAFCYMGTIVFDTVSRTFFVASYTAAMTYQYKEPSDNTKPSLSNMDYDLVFLRGRNPAGSTSMSNQGIYGLMKDPGTGKHFLLYFAGPLNGFGPSNYPTTLYLREVPDNSPMLQADVFYAPRSGDYIYYAKDNVLGRYRDVDPIYHGTVDIDQEIDLFDPDEKIAYVGDLMYDMYSDILFVRYPYDVYVLTNSDSGWKLYSFKANVNGEIDKSSRKEIGSGEGEAHSVMMRS